MEQRALSIRTPAQIVWHDVLIARTIAADPDHVREYADAPKSEVETAFWVQSIYAWSQPRFPSDIRKMVGQRYSSSMAAL